jgi:hypothetical protein
LKINFLDKKTEFAKAKIKSFVLNKKLFLKKMLFAVCQQKALSDSQATACL